MNTQIDILKDRLGRIETIIRATDKRILQPGVERYRERVLDETLGEYCRAIMEDQDRKTEIERAILKHLMADAEDIFNTATEDTFNTRGGVTVTTDYSIEDLFFNTTATITLMWAFTCSEKRGGDAGEWLRSYHYRNVEIFEIALFDAEGSKLSTEGIDLLALDTALKEHCEKYLAD